MLNMKKGMINIIQTKYKVSAVFNFTMNNL